MKFIQQAFKGNNGGLIYVGSLVLLFIGWQIVGLLPLTFVAYFYSDDMQHFMESSTDSFMSLGINSNLFLLLVIFSFAVALGSLLFCVKFLHHRKIITLFTSRKSIDFNRIFYSFSLWFVLATALISIDYFLNTENYINNFKPMPFLILSFISLFLLPIQTTFEEVLFRGYLLQGFGIWFKRPWVALIITSVIFGLLHIMNPEVQKIGMVIMVFYIGTGLLLGLITLLDDGTELAIGFHAANNIVAALFVTTNWSALQTDALLMDISEPSVGWETFLPVFVLYPLIVIVFSKKYGWKNWSGLFSKISSTNS